MTNYILTNNLFCTNSERPINQKKPEEQIPISGISNEMFDSMNSVQRIKYLKPLFEGTKLHELCKDNFDVVLSGLLAIMHKESGLHSTVKDTKGSGILAWNKGRLKRYQLTMNKTPNESSVDEQINYAISEALDNPPLIRKLIASKTPEEAASAWTKGYRLGNKMDVTKEAEQLYPLVNGEYDEMLNGLPDKMNKFNSFA